MFEHLDVKLRKILIILYINVMSLMSASNSTIVSPVYYRIIERRGNGWGFKEGAAFVNWLNAPLLSQEELFAAFDTSMKKVAPIVIPYQWW